MNVVADTLRVIRDPADPSPFPVAVRAGRFVFAPCVVNLAAGQPQALAVWRSRAEAKAALTRLGAVMQRAGSSLAQVVNLLQCFQGRGQTAGYVEERRGYFPDGVPTSTGTAGTRLAGASALIQLDATAIVPEPGETFAYLGGTSANASYSNALSWRDLVYYSGVMTNLPETQPDPKLWFGSAVKNEFRYIMRDKLAKVLESSGCRNEDIAVAHIHLLHPQDDFGPLNDVMDELFPSRRPVFMVSPSSGLGAMPGRIEITPIAVRPGGATRVADIAVPGVPGLLGGPSAKQVGDFVYTTTLAAVDAHGRLANNRGASIWHAGVALEMASIVDDLEAIATAARTSTSRLVRLRLYVQDAANVAPAVLVVRHRIGDDLPVSVVEDAGAAGWYGAASITADAVFHAPA
jgi:enamine deaminase RidA (YjgF/YER057c/UK114 family)